MNALHLPNTKICEALLMAQFKKHRLKRIRLWIKDLVIWIRFITNPVPTLIFIFQSIY